MLIAWEARGDPQVFFLETVYIPFVVSASDGQTVQKTVEYPQLQFLDKVFFPSCCLVLMARQCRKLWSIHSCSSRTRHRPCSLGRWSGRRCKSQVGSSGDHVLSGALVGAKMQGSVLDRALFLGRILRRVELRSRGVWRSEC